MDDIVFISLLVFTSPLVFDWHTSGACRADRGKAVGVYGCASVYARGRYGNIYYNSLVVGCSKVKCNALHVLERERGHA